MGLGQAAWHLKETPYADYTWTEYIDNHLKMGIRNFVLGHITITESRIEFGGGARMRQEWQETGAFKYLRRNVIAKGGRILVDIKFTDFHRTVFDETVFLEEVAEFVKEFPVDGFRILANLEYKYPGIRGYKSEQEYFGSVKALLKTIRKLNKILAIWFKGSSWAEIFKHELGSLADINFLSLDIRNDTDIAVFNTDRYAEAVLLNASWAGMAPDKIILSIPLAAYGSIPRLGSYGYRAIVLDHGADPEGDGVVPGNSEQTNFYYFFSQKRGIDKIHLARDRGLHGISVESDRRRTYVDLKPWSPRSLTHALASNV
ncbi:hypothetical protein FOZ63_033667 [Perkinsus olseni]|uniref:Uncharacterized protein n=1 Tax=Perkinsus olseni TaxID=32597 RepID=A0A7J6RXM2_PEROL|nr:hypothetical protein FOZ62_031202 [Perkinsus olseni]KAF4725223.1 hypothetical protein FOZ63_033667 [Perkinsus olseni]